MSQHRYKLCGILEHLVPGMLSTYMKHPDIDMIECRLDIWEGLVGRVGIYSFFDGLMEAQRWPVIIVCRPRKYGGLFNGSNDERLALMMRAVNNGAEWVELEYDAPLEFFQMFGDSGVRIVCSYQLKEKDPVEESFLLDKCFELAAFNPHVIKITGPVKTSADCCAYLQVIPKVKARLKKDVIAYGLGPLGKWSRITCLFVGSPWTYVQFSSQGLKTDYQLDAHTVRLILKYMSSGEGELDTTCTDPNICGYRYSY